MSNSLLTALCGQVAGDLLALSPRLQAWCDAFEAWLAALQADHGPTASNQARYAWSSLLALHRCLPWDLDQPKLEAWLERLAEDGHTANTIRCYRGRISGFYRYAFAHPALAADPLFAGGVFINPFRRAANPTPRNYENAYILRPYEARALLRAIDRHTSLIGCRDYALLLTLLLTAQPEAAILSLLWQDLPPASPDPAFPQPALDAILAYLRRAGRLDTIQPLDYIFAPLADPLRSPAAADPKVWDPTRPLSHEQALVALKCYAAWAGLDAPRLTYLALRHTAAALRLECGDDPAALQRLLCRSTFQDTRCYIQHLGAMLQARGRPPHPWLRRLRPLLRRPHLPPPLPGLAPARRKPYAQPGNTNALRHGLYYSRLLPGELADIDFEQVRNASLDDEIIGLRLLLTRAFRHSDKADPLKVLDLFGQTALRISTLIRQRDAAQRTSAEQELQNALQETLDEIFSDRDQHPLAPPPEIE